jgi:hypothetical protein
MMKYGLLLSLIVSSNISAMIRDDLKNLPYEQLKERQDANDQKIANIYSVHGKVEAKWAPYVGAQMSALITDNRALMNAIMFGGVPKELIKAHGITGDQPDKQAK